MSILEDLKKFDCTQISLKAKDLQAAFGVKSGSRSDTRFFNDYYRHYLENMDEQELLDEANKASKNFIAREIEKIKQKQVLKRAQKIAEQQAREKMRKEIEFIDNFNELLDEIEEEEKQEEADKEAADVNALNYSKNHAWEKEIIERFDKTEPPKPLKLQEKSKKYISFWPAVIRINKQYIAVGYIRLETAEKLQKCSDFHYLEAIKKQPLIWWTEGHIYTTLPYIKIYSYQLHDWREKNSIKCSA